MYTVYVIRSLIKNWIYVWMTNDLERRLYQHNHWYNKSTKPYIPFELLYTEFYDLSVDAKKREKYRKSWIGKQKLKQKYTKDVVGLPIGR